MSILDSTQNLYKHAIKSGEAYVDATQDYFELKAFKHVALFFSLLVKILIIGGLVFAGAALLVIAGILVLGEYIGSVNLAIVYVSLMLFGLSFIVYLVRKPLIESRMIQKISTSFFDN